MLHFISPSRRHIKQIWGRFTKGLGALFSVQSIPLFPPGFVKRTNGAGNTKTACETTHMC